MTTKVIIEVPDSNHDKDVVVSTVHAKTLEPYGYEQVVKRGTRIEMYVWSNQSLVIKEVERDNEAEGEEQAPSS